MYNSTSFSTPFHVDLIEQPRGRFQIPRQKNSLIFLMKKI